MSNIFEKFACLYATPYDPIEEDSSATDVLGWRRRRRRLQREGFPMFTVLTGNRRMAEVLLYMVGVLTEPENAGIEKTPPVNAFFRRFELLIALAMLSRKPKGNLAEVLKGYLNSERFIDYWEKFHEKKIFTLEKDDSKERYMQLLGYGIGAHYCSSLTSWGLIRKERGKFPVLTKEGRSFFEDKIRPYKNKTERLSKFRESLKTWFEDGRISQDKLKRYRDFLIPKPSTAEDWLPLADELARQDKETVFSDLWYLLEPMLRKPNEESEGLSGGDLRRSAEARLYELKDEAARCRVERYFHKCRELEQIGGTAEFLLMAMVETIQNMPQSSDNNTARYLADEWEPWLARRLEYLKRNFQSKTTDPDLKAFLQAPTPKDLLEAVLKRHVEVKAGRALLRLNHGKIERTPQMPPKKDVDELLKALTENPALASGDLGDVPDDPWREFTEFDFHWGRFARWMRPDEQRTDTEQGAAA